jgi:alkylhydroperoxidase/carboxymuconolactone decarboxylase family protein YurZ
VTDCRRIQCVKTGVSYEELCEAVSVALLTGGSIAVPHLLCSLEMIGLLRAEGRKG